MALRVKLTNDRDYSAAIFNVAPHATKGYHVVSADLVLKTARRSNEEKIVKADRVHIYCKDLGFYESMGNKVPQAVAGHFCTTMKNNQGSRIMIKEIVDENQKKFAKPIIAVGVELNSP
jgi:hypothetical protein